MANPRPYQRIGDIGSDPNDYDQSKDLHALEFDGVDDYLLASGMQFLTLGTGTHTTSAGYRNTGGAGYLLHSSGNAVTSTNIQYALLMRSGPGENTLRYGADSKVPHTDGVAGVLSSTYSIPLGLALARESGSDYPVTVKNAPDGIDTMTIGCRTPDAPAVFWGGDCYGVVIAEGYRPGRLSVLEEYLARKSGVVL